MRTCDVHARLGVVISTQQSFSDATESCGGTNATGYVHCNPRWSEMRGQFGNLLYSLKTT